MASKSYTLLEYLVTLETELKKLKKVVAESVGADYSELIAQINGIGNELNSFKSSITDTVNTNNSEITSKFNSLEQQFNTFKTSITNTVNSNKTEITTQVNTLNTQFSQFKTTLESQVSSLTTRVTSVENRVTTLENSGGSTGGSTGESVNIDDNNISKNSTWSSSKIEDFVHNNDGTIWTTEEGINLSIQYTKEGYLRELEIIGNTTKEENGVNLFDEILRQGDISSSTGEDTVSTSRISCVNFIDVKGSITLYVYRQIAGGNFAFRCYDSSKKCLGSTVADRNNQMFSSKLLTNTCYVKFIDETNNLNNKYTIALEPVSSYIPYNNNETTYNNLGVEVNGKYKIDIVSRNYKNEEELSSISPKIYNKSILLPCQLCSNNEVYDRLYWDNEKNKYVIEKKIINNAVLDSSQIIETDITKILKIPCYIHNTYLFVTGGIDGGIKCKAPLDGGQVVQTLRLRNEELKNEVSTLSLENEEIKEVNNTQDILIDTTMLATDEIFTMIEPILEVIPQNMTLERSTSKMVDMYVCMIQRGLKTIEEVPARYREEVKRILEELEK